MNAFNSFGEQLQAIAKAQRTHTTDQRLTGAYNSASGLGSQIGTEGGFLITPEYADTFISKTYDNSIILGRADIYEPEKFLSEFKIPKFNETSRADGSRLGGVRVYRTAEAEEIEKSSFKVGEMAFAGNPLKGLCFVTEEMLQDAAMLEKIVTDAFSKELAFTADFESYRGSGVGENLGIINSGAVIQIDPETEQSDSIVIDNIDKMWARCWGAGRANSIWVYNQGIEADILAAIRETRYFETAAPYNTLLGRPMIPAEFCSAPGDYGDFALITPSEYAVAKSKKTDLVTSIHVKFLTGEMAFRFVVWLQAMPKWESPITPRFGTDTLSPFVVLKARN